MTLGFAVFLLALFAVATQASDEHLCCGPLEDAKCGVADVERANIEQLYSILMELSAHEQFQLFHLPSDRECPYWHTKAPLSSSSSASITSHSCDVTAPADDALLFNELSSSSQPPACSVETEPTTSSSRTLFVWQPNTDAVDRSITRKEDVALRDGRANEGVDCDDAELPSFWLDMCGAIDDSEANDDSTSTQFVSLIKNPERWTGYNGSDIWRAMYEENCFRNENMCYEERVLYRLLSGMHASINIHISKNYYPPRKGKRDVFEPNALRYWHQFAEHPDRLRNLHFAFVVLLRAVQRGADYFAQQTQYGERGLMLVRRLIDSKVLHSCSAVFSAFDESMLFSGDGGTLPTALKHQFKDVFRNISTLFDCITCQQCKLHGKLQLLGVGTALKLLLLPKEMISVTRQEAVALFNTLAKFSEAIVASRDLEQRAHKLLEEQKERQQTAQLQQRVLQSPPTIRPPLDGVVHAAVDVNAHVFNAIGVLRRLSRSGHLSSQVERQLLGAAAAREPALLALTWHYSGEGEDAVLGEILRSLADTIVRMSTQSVISEPPMFDAVVVGGGLSGLVCAVRLAERGGRVLLLEKEAFFGGNSAWASSGVNAVLVDDPGAVFDPTAADGERDSVLRYRRDTLKSAAANSSALIDVLTGESGDALRWLRTHNVTLPLRGRLGGHSAERTYRPVAGMAGTELIRQMGRFAEGKVVGSEQFATRITIQKKARVTGLHVDRDGRVDGCDYVDAGGVEQRVKAHNVVLATGGYAADRGVGSLLAQYRPDLLHLGTTNGRWATGDGIRMALAVGADVINLRDVQVHPTAFVRKLRRETAEPLPADSAAAADEAEKPRTLCAEILRGVGGLLLDQRGEQFVDALETRKFIVENMMNHTARLRQDAAHASLPVRADEFVLIVGDSAAHETSHVALYEQKALLVPMGGVTELARWMRVDESVLRASLSSSPKLMSDTPFHVGIVGPALHYTMGGVRIDTDGRALRADGSLVHNVWAVGEVSGGVHGTNRLGGNALTECVVFGLAAGNAIPVRRGESLSQATPIPMVAATLTERTIDDVELASHASRSSCWVALFGRVFDFTDFLDEHPAGAQAILDFAGRDGSDKFAVVHSRDLLDDFAPIGIQNKR